MTQRHYLLVALLNAVHVDTVKEKSVVAIRPKPAFRPIFEVATTREGSGIALINQTPRTQDEPEASESCSWWRRGRLQLLIPYFLCRNHGGKKRGVFRLRFDIDELFPGDGDSQEYLPDQGLPFFVGLPGVKPEGWQVFQEVGGALQLGQVSRHDGGGGVHLELAHDDPPLPAAFIIGYVPPLVLLAEVLQCPPQPFSLSPVLNHPVQVQV